MDYSLQTINDVRLKSNLQSKLQSTAATTNNKNKETAQQFEALFIQSMVKSMRQASLGDPLTGSDQANMYRDMLDSQLSISLASNGGIGLASIIERQLGGANDQTDQKHASKIATNHAPSINRLSMAKQLWSSNYATTPATSTAQQNPQTNPTTAAPEPAPQLRTRWANPAEFIQELQPAAIKAAKDLGTKPEAVLAIAALETGWGKHIAKTTDGQSSFNLFGIKADSYKNSYKYPDQPTVMATTLEYTNGQFVQQREPFRSYQNPTDSIADFANFIQQNPRYQQALTQANDPESFLREIHKAGYATDPDYADKAVSVMQKVKTLIQGTISVADNSTSTPSRLY